MKGMLLGQFLYTKLNEHVLKLCRDRLVHRLLADGDRCSRGGPRGPALGRPVPLRPPPPPVAPPRPSVAWTAVLRHQVSPSDSPECRVTSELPSKTQRKVHMSAFLPLSRRQIEYKAVLFVFMQRDSPNFTSQLPGAK